MMDANNRSGFKGASYLRHPLANHLNDTQK